MKHPKLGQGSKNKKREEGGPRSNLSNKRGKFRGEKSSDLGKLEKSVSIFLTKRI